MNTTGKTLIFFDDACLLCNGVVKRLNNLDKSDQLRFTAFGSVFAKQHAFNFDNNAVVVLDSRGFVYTADKAVLYLFNQLPQLTLVAFFLKLIPTRLRSYFYQKIANNRYRFFGRYDNCSFPEKLPLEIRKKIIL
jgi:predicted DCC family thiol-disulfide oxidoreductase YuxK